MKTSLQKWGKLTYLNIHNMKGNINNGNGRKYAKRNLQEIIALLCTNLLNLYKSKF